MKARIRSRFLAVIVLMPLAVLAAQCPEPPPDVTYRRVPTAVKQVAKAPEVITIDNCDFASSSKQWVERSLTLGQTVYLDEEEAKSVAIAVGGEAGVSYYVQAGVQAQVQVGNEISKRVGAGFQYGETKTQGFQVDVGPHQIAVVTLQWTETWEEGYFEVFRNNNLIGRVHYRMLVDLRLDSKQETHDCTPMGRVVSFLTSKTEEATISMRSAWTSISSEWETARVAWPWGPLECWIGGVLLVVVALLVLLVLRRGRRVGVNTSLYDDVP